MAINLGTPAVEAIKELREHPAMGRFVDELGQIVVKRALGALSAQTIEQHALQGAHAQGIREVWEAIAAAYEGVTPAQVKAKPLPATIGAAARRENANV